MKHITFTDSLGQAVVEVDEYGIQFLNGVAYFSDEDGNEYRIPVENLVSIQ